MSAGIRILFIAPYPEKITPSQRFRFEHYLPILEKAGMEYRYDTFINNNGYKVIFQKGNTFKKTLFLLKGFIKRAALLFTLKPYDFIYIHREAAPLGPPLLEWIIARVWKKRIIYDFDDAIWISLTSEANPKAAKIKCTWKVAEICKWATVVSTGNKFLADYASRYAKDVRIIPTVVDTLHMHNKTKNHSDSPFTIGWTGTFTNFIHLPLVIPALKQLQSKYQFRILIIADKDPLLEDIKYEFRHWKLENEMEDLLEFHIGLMPLIKMKTDVQLGKCAFKAIQYMSLGIPAVVTPTGSNCEVVDHGINGFWADNDKEWRDSIEKLILDPNLRKETGKKAQDKINKEYSVIATEQSFLNLFANPVSP